MLFKKYHFLIVLIFSTASAQYITTDETYTPVQLIENVLIGSGCASVTNVSVSGGNFSSGEKSWGYFNANGSSFAFPQGIILSTGKIVDAQGPNSFISDDGAGMGWGGDPDLNAALGITNSLNATVLEFDFIPLGNQISFDYIFASEEYHGTATCTYSDGFAFLLKETGTTTYQNLALIPNTTIPVKVTTVHPDIPGGCPAENEQYFDAFNPTEYPTNFNGQTKVLTAQSAVIPGHQYHIKLVIADEGNYRYDSAIFLKASSFNYGVDLGDDRTFATNNPVCYNETLTLNGTSPTATSYQWYFENNPIPGETSGTLTFNPPYTASQNGTYSLSTSYSPTCATSTPIVVEFAPQLVTNQTVYNYCDADATQDGITTITLSDIVPTLFANLPPTYQVAFYGGPTSTTPLPDIYQNANPFQQIVYARISNSNCYGTFFVTLNVNVFSGTIADETLGMCNNSPTTLTADTGYQSYLWNTGQTTAAIQVTSPGTYTVTIENTDGCTKVKTFTVVGSEIATITNIVTNDFSDVNSVEIVATGSGNYEYSIDGINFQDSPIFTNLGDLIYTAYVRDKNGCGTISQEFYLIQIPKFFTPNGDGYNDYWNIKGIKPLSPNANSRITVFDRYGKLIKQFSPISVGWNGTYNGKLMPADDYWFTIELRDGRSTKGHFTLKR
ncbi:MAG: choice-of-anchor L domain-containing protein [Flavobacterium sp.]